jgi:hypothetical protein
VQIENPFYTIESANIENELTVSIWKSKAQIMAK